jgi:hypothetical protein
MEIAMVVVNVRYYIRTAAWIVLGEPPLRKANGRNRARSADGRSATYYMRAQKRNPLYAVGHQV